MMYICETIKNIYYDYNETNCGNDHTRIGNFYW